MIEGVLFLVAVAGLVDGAVFMLRRYIADGFPPKRTIEIVDELPF